MFKRKAIFSILLLLIISACGKGTNVAGPTAAPGSSTAQNPIPTEKFTNLSTVSSVVVGDSTGAIGIHNAEIYYTDTFNGMGSLDISNPPQISKTPPLISSAMLDTYDNFYGLLFFKNILALSVVPGCYGWCMVNFPGPAELRLYDMSVPAKPQYLTKLSFYPSSVAFDNNILYVTSIDENIKSHLYAIDVSNPASPVTLSATPISAPGYVIKQANLIYISEFRYDDNDTNKFKQIQIIDVSDVAKPVVENTFSNAWINVNYSPILMNNDILYILDVGGLNLVNLHDPMNPVFMKTIPIGYAATSFSMYNGKLYIAAGDAGVMVFNIEKPDDPRFIKSMKSDTAALSVTVSDGVGVYLTDQLKQYNSIGYSILRGKKINLFYDK